MQNNKTRIEMLYDMFKENLRDLPKIKDGDIRIKTFLEGIDYADADVLLVNTLKCIEKELRNGKKMDYLKMDQIYRMMREYHLNRELYRVEFVNSMRTIFNKWKHAIMVRKEFGWDMSTIDILKLYVYSTKTTKS